MGKQSSVFTLVLTDLTLTSHPFAGASALGTVNKGKICTCYVSVNRRYVLGSDSSPSEKSGWFLTRWNYSESI